MGKKKRKWGGVIGIEQESLRETIDELWGGLQKNQPVLRGMIASSLMLYPTRMSRWTELVAEAITVRVKHDMMSSGQPFKEDNFIVKYAPENRGISHLLLSRAYKNSSVSVSRLPPIPS